MMRKSTGSSRVVVSVKIVELPNPTGEDSTIDAAAAQVVSRETTNSPEAVDEVILQLTGSPSAATVSTSPGS